jgi:hypothetical protein
MATRRGWVRPVRAVAVFLAALVLFDRLFFVALQWALLAADRQAEMEHKLSKLTDPASYQWLILGTSRTYEAVHPSFIASELGVRAYKEAWKGKGPRYNYEFYQLYRRLVGTPRLVIYGLDYFMFGMPSEAAVMRRLGWTDAAGPRAAVAWPPLLMVANKPANDRAIVRIVERLQSRALSGSDSFDPEYHLEDVEAYTGNPESRVVPRPEPDRFETSAYARHPGLEGEYFTRLVREWTDEGVVVVLVYPPDYIATHRTNVEHAEFIEHVRQVVRGCARCVVLDYSDPARFPLTRPDFFWDGDYGSPNSHLSERGVEQFNRVFLPDLRRIAAGFGVLATRR